MPFINIEFHVLDYCSEFTFLPWQHFHVTRAKLLQYSTSQNAQYFLQMQIT